MPSWGLITVHVLIITLLSNVGKMFAALCYRKEASLRERLAVAVAMFPRGEVGAGVLVIGLSYGMAGPSLTVAVLSLALNLLCTGLFILVVKQLLAKPALQPSEAVQGV
jgi:Kef-type K+ transport system membrane component KefB